MTDHDFLQALRELYAGVDAAFAEEGIEFWPGDCQPGRNGAQPQPYALEVDLIRAVHGRRLPSADAEFGEACPFFSGGRCEVYEVRPFHCRTYVRGSRVHWVAVPWQNQLEDLCRDHAAAQCQPFRGYPLWLHYSCRRGVPAEWLDVT